VAIRDGSSVEVSIIAAGSDVGRRVIDFLAGVAVTGSATMTRIERGVFLIVPEGEPARHGGPWPADLPADGPTTAGRARPARRCGSGRNGQGSRTAGAHGAATGSPVLPGRRRALTAVPRRDVGYLRHHVTSGSLSADLSAHHGSLGAIGRRRAPTDTARRRWPTSNNDLLTPMNADECERHN